MIFILPFDIDLSAIITTIHIMASLLHNLNWSAIIPIITAGTAITSIVISIIVLKLTAKERHLDNERKNSEFYLKQSQNYFHDAIKLLESADNNNIKWHQAIALLQSIDNTISHQLTEQSHKNVYCLDYINTGYAIVDIIKEIGNFKFFYGLLDNPYGPPLGCSKLPDKTPYLISPNSLSCLCRFIDKASKASYDINTNKAALEKIFNQAYFQKDITDEPLNHDDISGFTKITVKKILEYLADYKQNQKTQGLSQKE